MAKRDYENERPSRSNRYQYIMCEIAVDGEYLSSFDNSQSMDHHLNPYKYDERLMEAKDQLKKAFWKLADSIMTDRQKFVLHGIADGYTQTEVAKMLNVNQSSVTKALNGNITYGENEKQYGGAIKKLKKACANDSEIQEILQKIFDLQEERY